MYYVEENNAENSISEWNIQAAFYMAIKNDDVNVVRDLLSSKLIDVDAKFGPNEHPAVMLAVESGNINVLKCLLDHGCSVNQADKYGETPLHRAVSDRRLDIMRLLLEQRAKSVCTNNITGSTPFHFAVDTARLDVVQLLTSLAIDQYNGCRIADGEGRTPLLSACVKGHNDIVGHFVEQCQCSTNIRDNRHFGDAPLHYILKLSIATVKLLLEHGADVTAKNFAGLTPLHILAADKENQEENYAKSRLLIQFGAKLESRDYMFHRTPLHWATVTRNFDFARTLLQLGASVETKDRYRRSSMYYVAKSNVLKMVEMYLAFSNCRLSKESWLCSPTSADDKIEPDTLMLLRNYKNQLPNSLKWTVRSSLLRLYDEDQIKQLPLPIHLISYLINDRF